MANSGLIVKNAKIALANGAYNKIDSQTAFASYLSSDELCEIVYKQDNKYTQSQDMFYTNTVASRDERYYKFTENNTYIPLNETLKIGDVLNAEIYEAFVTGYDYKLETDIYPTLGSVYYVKNNDEFKRVSVPSNYLITDSIYEYDSTTNSYIRTSDKLFNSSKDYYTLFNNSFVKINSEFTKSGIISGSLYVKEDDVYVLSPDIVKRSGIAYYLYDNNTYTEVNDLLDNSIVSRYSTLYRKVSIYNYVLTEDTVVTEDTAYKQYFAKYGENDYREITFSVGNVLNRGYKLYVYKDISSWQILRKSDKYVLYYSLSLPTSSPAKNQSWIIAETGEYDSTIDIQMWDSSSIIAEKKETIDEDGAKRITTIYTNVVTGDKYTDTNVIREKTVYNVNEIDRLDYVQLMTNKVYRFQFVSEFEKLGWIPGDVTQKDNAGIYKVDKILPYFEVAAAGIDIYVNLYEPCGVPKSVFDSDKERMAQSVVYRISDPNDPSIMYYMPQIFIKGTPDASVIKYNKVLLSIDLGVQPDESEIPYEEYIENGVKKKRYVPQSSPTVLGLSDLYDIEDTITKVLEKLYGIKSTSNTKLVKTAIYDKIWLTDETFGKIRNYRKETKNSCDYDLISEFNLEKENRIFLENRQLKHKVGVLEEALRKLNS